MREDGEALAGVVFVLTTLLNRVGPVTLSQAELVAADRLALNAIEEPDGGISLSAVPDDRSYLEEL